LSTGKIALAGNSAELLNDERVRGFTSVEALMRLLVVNPNTTASMTRKIGEAARAAAGESTEIIAPIRNPPGEIEGYYDEYSPSPA